MTREVKDQIPKVQDIWLSKQDQCMDRRGQGTFMMLIYDAIIGYCRRTIQSELTNLASESVSVMVYGLARSSYDNGQSLTQDYK